MQAKNDASDSVTCMKDVLSDTNLNKLGAVLEMLVQSDTSELKSISDILPYLVSNLSKIESHDEIKATFQIVTKLVQKDAEWSSRLTATRFFEELRMLLIDPKIIANPGVIQNFCLMINAATFQNPTSKAKLASLKVEQAIYAVLRDRSNSIYKVRSGSNSWKLPALKTLNNVQGWSKDFNYCEEYFESLYTLVKSFEDESKAKILVDEPLTTAGVLFNILKIMIIAPSFKYQKYSRLAKLLDIGLHLSEDVHVTADCLTCLSGLRKRKDILDESKPHDIAIIIQEVTMRAVSSPKIFSGLVSELCILVEVLNNLKERNGFFSTGTIETLLTVLSSERSDKPSPREIFRFFGLLAKLEYVGLLQRHECQIFDIFQNFLINTKEPAILTELFHTLYLLSKLSMTYNEKIAALVVPHVIQKAKNNWQDRILILRAMEITNSIIGSVEVNQLIQENILILLAKCLDVWRFDITLLEVILTILNGIPLDQWDIYEEINKLNFIQLVKAIEVSTEGKLSPIVTALCSQFLRSLSDAKPPADQVKQMVVKQMKEEVLALSSNITQMLSQGEMMSIYTEDGRIKRMHVMLVKELNFVVCKDVNSITVKDKYTMVVHEISKLVKGYEKTGKTAFERGTGFFSRYPKPEHCFSLFSNTSNKGQKNFHFCCKDGVSATKWYNAINEVIKFKRSAYKKALEKNGK